MNENDYEGYSLRVTGPGGSAAELTIEGRPSLKVLDQFFNWFKSTIRTLPFLLSEWEVAQLERLQKKKISSLSQKDYELLRNLQEKARAIEERSAKVPAKSLDVTESPKPIMEKKIAQKPVEEKTAGKDLGRMSQAEYEAMMNQRDQEKRKPKGGGMFSTTRRRSGFSGNRSAF